MNDNSLVFFNDPKRFLEAIACHEVEARHAILNHNLKDIMICEIIRYGVFNDSKMIGPLQAVYNDVFLSQFNEDERWEIFRYVTDMIQAVDFVSVNAYLPFIAEDPAKRIVSTAVIDYVSLGPLTDNDPMSRVKDITGMIENGYPKNPGAAFGGLLFLGDTRVCKLLWPLKEQLDKDEANIAIKCSTGFLYAATIEFFIDWLEGMEGDDFDSLFGIVSSGLAIMRKNAQYDVVIPSMRQFPVPKEVSPKQQEKNRSKFIPIKDYVKKISSRLYALEMTEPPPRVMPHVLSMWGLEPKSSSKDIAEFDDKVFSGTPKKIKDQSLRSNSKIERSDRENFDGTGNIYLIWGLLNPNGPTLYCIGDKNINGKKSIFFRWFHMMGGSTYYSQKTHESNISYQSIYDAIKEITAHLKQINEPAIFDHIPSFIIINNNDATMIDIIKSVMLNSDCAHKNWSREMAYLNQFGDDFFGRAGCEIRESYDAYLAKPDRDPKMNEFLDLYYARYSHIPAFTEAKIPQFDDYVLNEDILETWWNFTNKLEFQKHSLNTLSEMWSGAASMMPEKSETDLVKFTEVAKFIDRFGFRF